MKINKVAILAVCVCTIVIAVLAVKSMYSTLSSDTAVANNIKIGTDTISMDIASTDGKGVSDYGITKKGNELYVKVTRSPFNSKPSMALSIPNKYGDFDNIYISGKSESDKTTIWYKSVRTLKGESNDWNAVYRMDQGGAFNNNNGKVSFDGWNKNKMSITYRHDESELPYAKSISISYPGGERTWQSDKPERISKSYDFRGGALYESPENKNLRFTVEVNIDGESQEITLMSSK